MSNALSRTVMMIMAQALLPASLFGWQAQPPSTRSLPAPAASTDSQPQWVVPASETVRLPKGTPVCMLATQSLSTKTARLNQRVVFRVGQNVTSLTLIRRGTGHGPVLIPKGTEVWGTVKEVQRPGMYSHAKLSFAFEALPLANGQTVPIRHRATLDDAANGETVLIQRAAPVDLFPRESRAIGSETGPRPMSPTPMVVIPNEPDKIFTTSTCVPAEIDLDLRFDTEEALKLQEASSSAAKKLRAQPVP